MQRKQWSRGRPVASSGEGSDGDAEIAAEGLFRKASGLLLQAGYRAGRTRRTRTASQASRHLDIRAPGPIQPHQSLLVFPDSESQSEDSVNCLDRCSASFHAAKVRENRVQSRVSCRRSARSGAVSERHQRFVDEQEEAANREINLADKAALRALFSDWKKVEVQAIEKKVQRQFAARSRFRLFDAETNKVRIDTSKLAALGLRYALDSIKTKLRPMLCKARSRIVSQRSPNSSRCHKPRQDLRSYLEEVLVGQVAVDRKAVQDEELMEAQARIQWLARVGIKGYLPRGAALEVQRWNE